VVETTAPAQHGALSVANVADFDARPTSLRWANGHHRPLRLALTRQLQQQCEATTALRIPPLVQACRTSPRGLGAFYLDVLKDPCTPLRPSPWHAARAECLWTSPALVRLMAPVLSFTARRSGRCCRQGHDSVMLTRGTSCGQAGEGNCWRNGPTSAPCAPRSQGTGSAAHRRRMGLPARRGAHPRRRRALRALAALGEDLRSCSSLARGRGTVERDATSAWRHAHRAPEVRPLLALARGRGPARGTSELCAAARQPVRRRRDEAARVIKWLVLILAVVGLDQFSKYGYGQRREGVQCRDRLLRSGAGVHRAQPSVFSPTRGWQRWFFVAWRRWWCRGSGALLWGSSRALLRFHVFVIGGPSAMSPTACCTGGGGLLYFHLGGHYCPLQLATRPSPSAWRCCVDQFGSITMPRPPSKLP